MSPAPRADHPGPDYCGCCGNEIVKAAGRDPEWCWRCEPHAAPVDGRPGWERTHLALYGTDCAFQVS